MIIIVPCCGESQRYNGVKKQFLNSPSGLPLPVFSVSGIKGAHKIIYTFIAKEYMYYYGDKRTLFGGDICLLNNQTKSQVETVVHTIISMGLQNSPVYIKDCDNYFETYALPNTVTIRHTANSKFKINNKSFTKVDESNFIINIAEREEISQLINVGGYGFTSGHLFLQYSQNNRFISEVILSAIKSGSIFTAEKCENYIDYGEQDDYDQFVNKYKK